MIWYISVVFLLLIFCKNVFSQNSVLQETYCQSYDNCNSCIEAESYCVWCFQQDFKGDRCSLKSSLLRQGCNEKYIYLNEDESTIAAFDSNKEFRDVENPDRVQESVQIKPQKVSVKLRPKQPLSVKFKYRVAKDYPLDLYYLMDLTVTMEHDVTTMAALGKELTELLRDLTKHFRVAFGYYSDKVAMPFSKMTDQFLENPCSDSGKTCRKGFDFIHSLNFTNDIDKFIEKVTASRTTSNLDNLEGGMDALYQIILCEEEMQWHKQARRIVVVATDGTLHFAGDGILAGAIRRNRNQCLLDESGIYSTSLNYDYPSLEEVYHRLLQNKMNVLFAAKKDAVSYYTKLKEIINSVSYVGLLEEKSTNVLELVKDGYLNVVKNVKFTANHSDNIKVNFKANCNQLRMWNASNICTNIELGKEYEFEALIELERLPKGLKGETIIIEEQNIQEKLLIEVEYVGMCKCGGTEKENNRNCSNQGTYKCGICECEEGWKGVDCEISCGEYRIEECRQKDETHTSSTCYGRGDCYCGKCICDEGYTGKYCQEKQCPKDANGNVCGGLNRGTCNDGVCECKENYMGDDCSCIKSQEHCIAPGSSDVCSGIGTCRCGKCRCPRDYSGDYCEICTDCKGLCSNYEECVFDTLENVTNSEKCLRKDGTVFRPIMVDKPISAESTSTCYMRYEQEDGQICDVYFLYDITRGFVNLKIHKACQKPIQASALIGIIVGVILGMGILGILLWKAKIMNDDRIEYAKFERELEFQKTMDMNPLYDSPIRRYEMPMELRSRSNS